LTGIVRHMPQPHLLLVSKQFSHEYKAVLAKRATLVVEERLQNIGDPVNLELSSTASNVSYLEIEMYMDILNFVCQPVHDSCCSTWSGTLTNFGWIGDLLNKLPRLQSAAIHLHIATTRTFSGRINKKAYEVHSRELGRFEKVKNIKVIINEALRGVRARDWKYQDEERWIYAEWKVESSGEMIEITEPSGL
jgi:hypothetical protein